MGKQFFRSIIFSLIFCIGINAQTPSAPLAPYVGAIIVDADTGSVIFDDNPDRLGSPASTLKLMTLLVIQERITAGKIQLSDMVAVSKKAYATGGSQVYLDPRESFQVEDMLYALMIQSANDAAVALAEHVAWLHRGVCEADESESRRAGYDKHALCLSQRVAAGCRGITGCHHCTRPGHSCV